MEGIGWCAEAMKAAQARLTTAADNLANAQSDGFHKHVLRFSMTPHGLSEREQVLRTTGPLHHTDRNLDLAIIGNGSLRVAPLHGPVPERAEITASRGGSFTRDAAGYVLDAQGRGLIGSHGFVRIHDDYATISPSGAVISNGQTVDRLATAPATRIASGFVETANVDAITEMVAVLDAQRSFETAEKSLTALDAARQKAIDDVGQVNGTG